MAERPTDLERRQVELPAFGVRVPHYPGLELRITELAIEVEGVGETVPADCTCGHGVDAHGDEKTNEGPCSGVVLLKDQEDIEGLDDPSEQGPCDCKAYEPAHDPHELVFRVERLIEVVRQPSATLARVKEIDE